MARAHPAAALIATRVFVPARAVKAKHPEADIQMSSDPPSAEKLAANKAGKVISITTLTRERYANLAEAPGDAEAEVLREARTR